jgi:hypothetical protein
MNLGELKAIIDSLHELHGPETNTGFHYQRASGRTGMGNVSAYRVSVNGPLKSVYFDVDYPRGVQE